MKILIDMNLSLDWCQALSQSGIEVIHWSDIGETTAKELNVWQPSWNSTLRLSYQMLDLSRRKLRWT
jgi:predicted nuclease of predicted toxin-antitoxin system